MRRMLILFCLIALSITVALAQSDESESWTVIERCVDEPVTPLDDWSFEGVIYAIGNGVIRGYRSDIPTTFIVVFSGENFITGATISPNGRYIAVPSGYSQYANMLTRHYIVDELRIYRTDLTRLVEYRIPVDTVGLFHSSEANGVAKVYWLDNTHIYYNDLIENNPETVIINIETGIKEVWTHEYAPQEIAPNNMILANYAANFLPPIWLSNSTLLMLEYNNGEYFLNIVSPDGTIQQTIFSGLIATNPNPSPDEKFIAFGVENTLYIADLEEQKIYNTCLVDNPMYPNFWRTDLGWININISTWSPDSTQVALNINDNIIIFDIESWQAYRVNNNFGDVMAWLPIP